MQDKIVNCKRCHGDACYETDHTFSTGLNIKAWQCLGCGFTTNTTMKEGSDDLILQEAQLPELHKDLKFIDKDGLVWFPCTINIPELGIVFLNGTSAKEWGWAGVKAVPVDKDEQKKFPIPGASGRFYQHKSDMSTLTMFGMDGFMEALDFINFFGNKNLVK